MVGFNMPAIFLLSWVAIRFCCIMFILRACKTLALDLTLNENVMNLLLYVQYRSKQDIHSSYIKWKSLFPKLVGVIKISHVGVYATTVLFCVLAALIDITYKISWTILMYIEWYFIYNKINGFWISWSNRSFISRVMCWCKKQTQIYSTDFNINLCQFRLEPPSHVRQQVGSNL